VGGGSTGERRDNRLMVEMHHFRVKSTTDWGCAKPASRKWALELHADVAVTRYVRTGGNGIRLAMFTVDSGIPGARSPHESGLLGYSSGRSIKGA
jgi:hypothetical protein